MLNKYYGATLPFRETIFGGTTSFVSISPNMVSYSNNLHAVLGHELIHAYHLYTGLYARLGSLGSEYYALKFSASVPHSTQFGAKVISQNMGWGIPYSHYSVYPTWVLPF